LSFIRSQVKAEGGTPNDTKRRCDDNKPRHSFSIATVAAALTGQWPLFLSMIAVRDGKI